MFYVKPEAKIICFAPVENIAAADWQWDLEVEGGSGTGSEFDISLPTNPEGDA